VFINLFSHVERNRKNFFDISCYCYMGSGLGGFCTQLGDSVWNVWQKPGAHVLYLGAASGTTVSHVSDIVGPVSFGLEDILNMFRRMMRSLEFPCKYGHEEKLFL
jgi:hypothetical protein